MLLSQRADPEFRTPQHMTPLMVACLHGQKSIVEKLIVRGAKCRGVHDIHGHSPFMWAIDSFDPDNQTRLDICEILLKQGHAQPSEIIVTGAENNRAEMSMLHYVCLPGMAKLAQLLLDHCPRDEVHAFVEEKIMFRVLKTAL